MNWSNKQPAMDLGDLATPVEKAGASESVAIVAIIWGSLFLLLLSRPAPSKVGNRQEAPPWGGASRAWGGPFIDILRDYHGVR